MQKSLFTTVLVLIFFLIISSVSAVDSVNVTLNQVINSSSNIVSYIGTNQSLPDNVDISGIPMSMSQFLYLLTAAVVNINSNSNMTIALGNYSNASAPSENITNSNINSTEYLDIANRIKSFMDSNLRAPNYATQTSTGSTIRFESLVYMYSQILNYYHQNGVLPDNLNVTSWTNISTINKTNIIGKTSFGYVEKEIYGNQSSNQTIILIVGLHPEENGIHTAIINALGNQTLNLTKRYVLYNIHVTQDANDYSKGRMNGQLLAQQFVVPDAPKENPILALDIHENHYKDSGYAYSRFLYPISNTTITTTYANEIISKMPFLVIYTPPNHTSPEYVTIPIANYGIPTIIYETYINDNSTQKASDAMTFIGALNSEIGKIPVVNLIKLTANTNIKTGLYNIAKKIKLSMNTAGTIYYSINGTIPSNTSIKYTGPITISSTTTLKFIATNTEGNKSPVYTEKYTIDKTSPKITSINPKNGAKGYSRTTALSIKFSENIKTSTNWSKIYIKNLNTAKTVEISKLMSSNTLNIKMTKKRLAYNQYLVYIPTAAVKDNANNNLASSYTFKFKTGA